MALKPQTRPFGINRSRTVEACLFSNPLERLDKSRTPMKKRLSNILFVWLPLFFLVAYVVSYFVLADPKGVQAAGLLACDVHLYCVKGGMYKLVEFIYMPIWQLDTKILRPSAWKVEP